VSGDPPPAVEMRPRPIYRYTAPLLALVWLGLVRDGTALERFVVPVCLIGITFAAWREFTRLEDGVIYQRGVLRWRKPVILSEVTSVSLHYESDGRDLPHREMQLWWSHGVTYVSMRWWSNAKPFLRAVMTELTEPNPQGRRRIWKVEADAKTRSRLEYL
jgi:hypothetical protein